MALLALTARGILGVLIVLVPVTWSSENGYSLIVGFDDSSRITSTRYHGLAKADYANYDRWKRPEIGQ